MKKKCSPSTSLFCIAFWLMITLAAFSFISCSSPGEEELIRQSIKKAASHAEDSDLEQTMAYISPDYSDDQDRKMEDIAQLLESYLGKYRGIAINILEVKINNMNPLEADVETDLGLSSGALQAFRKVSRYAGYFYRFKLKLVKRDDNWLVKWASWEQISQQELNKEAAEKLKELFPNL